MNYSFIQKYMYMFMQRLYRMQNLHISCIKLQIMNERNVLFLLPIFQLEKLIHKKWTIQMRLRWIGFLIWWEKRKVNWIFCSKMENAGLHKIWWDQANEFIKPNPGNLYTFDSKLSYRFAIENLCIARIWNTFGIQLKMFLRFVCMWKRGDRSKTFSYMKFHWKRCKYLGQLN